MNTAYMTDEQLAEVEGGIAPLLLLAAAVLTVGGCSASCTRKEADGTTTEVKVQIGAN